MLALASLLIAPVVSQQTLYAQAPPGTTCDLSPSLPHAQAACACHYISCTPTGDCQCGWDAKTNTCKAGIQTDCNACPTMRRCGTDQPLLLYANHTPVVGQNVGWGADPHRVNAQGQIVPANPKLVGPNAASQEQPGPSQEAASQEQPQQAGPPQQPPAGQQSSSEAPAQQQSSSSQQVRVPPLPPALYQEATPAPGQLYVQGVPNIPATGCQADSACGCHYLSCTPTGVCACGWDEKAKACKAGVTTTCNACPTMRRCGTDQPLLLYANNTPVVGQNVSWGVDPHRLGMENDTVVAQPVTTGKGKKAKKAKKAKKNGKKSS